MDDMQIMPKIDEENLDDILEIFRPRIKKSLYNTSFQEREDLEQEIALKIFEKLSILQSLEVPTFFEFIGVKSSTEF